jgi:hypothetical protein
MTDSRPEFQKEVVTKNLYRHVEHLSVKIGERHLWKNGSLSQTTEYIESVFASCGYEVWHQTYSCYSKGVSNLKKRNRQGGFSHWCSLRYGAWYAGGR